MDKGTGGTNKDDAALPVTWGRVKGMVVDLVNEHPAITHAEVRERVVSSCHISDAVPLVLDRFLEVFGVLARIKVKASCTATMEEDGRKTAAASAAAKTPEMMAMAMIKDEGATEENAKDEARDVIDVCSGCNLELCEGDDYEGCESCCDVYCGECVDKGAFSKTDCDQQFCERCCEELLGEM